METTFFIWPPPDHGSHGATAIPPPPRAARAKKKPAGPKKLPQRGLGVEQLERLRLQEHLRKMDKSDHLSLAAPPRPGFSLFYHVAAARYPAVIPPPEFPSSQSLHCSEQCELCVRTKRLLGERVVGVERQRKDPMDEGGTEELKEFMFFPSSSKLGELKRASEEWIPRSASIEGNQLDLSLKLSL